MLYRIDTDCRGCDDPSTASVDFIYSNGITRQEVHSRYHCFTLSAINCKISGFKDSNGFTNIPEALAGSDAQEIQRLL
jgi:hypothetical protein